MYNTEEQKSPKPNSSNTSDAYFNGMEAARNI